MGSGSSSGVIRARGAAERWSLPVDAGLDPAGVMSDPALDELLASQPAVSGLRTRRTPAFLAWRYGFGPLRYRVVLAGSDIDHGFAVFRVRRRGRAVEASVSDVVVPDGDPRLCRTALRRAASTPGVDYALTPERR